jgi:putative FmdB family regulatory protein
MPIYEYRCQDCGSKFEKLVRRSEEVAGLQCPSCGKPNLQQEFSTFAPQSGGSKSEAPPCQTGGCCPGSCNWQN